MAQGAEGMAQCVGRRGHSAWRMAQGAEGMEQKTPVEQALRSARQD